MTITIRVLYYFSDLHVGAVVNQSVQRLLPYGLDDRGSTPSRSNDGMFFATASRPALRSTKPPIQRVLGALTQVVKRPRR